MADIFYSAGRDIYRYSTYLETYSMGLDDCMYRSGVRGFTSVALYFISCLGSANLPLTF